MVKKSFKSLKQLYREECLANQPIIMGQPLEMDDIIWDDDYDEFVRLKDNTIIHIHPDKLQTIFPFPYSESNGDYDKKKDEAQQQVNLDYAIAVNTQNIDFILKCLREKPSLEYGALYITKDSSFDRDNSMFRSITYIRTYPDVYYMRQSERQKLVMLKDLDDRKALYSAYKKVHSSVVNRLKEWNDKYRHNAFEFIMYNID